MAPAGDEVVAVHAVDRLGAQGQLRVRTDRELQQGPGCPPAELLGHPQRSGDLDRAPAGDDRRQTRQPHAPHARQARIQRAAEGRRLHAAGDPATVRPRAAGSGGSAWLCAFALAVVSSNASAQTLTQRGFVDGSVVLFPQEASNDPTRLVGDLLARDDVFVKPAAWVQFAGGIDLRANTHDQVEDSWRVDLTDRTIRRPRVAVRRLSATVTRGPLTVDAGKQFIRWGKTDIVTPTDRFAPRDFLNVIDTEFIAVIGVRSVVQVRDETFEGVWLPRFTPSRVPLLDQRWTVVAGQAAELPLVDAGSTLPGGSQAGVRWSHVGGGFEFRCRSSTASIICRTSKLHRSRRRYESRW